MNDIYRILERLDTISEGIDPAQAKVKQLPALFKPKSASPALAGKYPTRNATRGYMVGEDDASVTQQVEITFSPDDIEVIERASQRMPGTKILKHIIDQYETVAGIDHEGDASLKLSLSSDDRVAIESLVEKFGYSLDETGIFRHIMRELDQQSMNEQADKTDLAEAMAEIEEDMLSKVKKDLTNYLDMLEKKQRVDRELRDKAVDAVERGQAEEDDEVDQEPVGEDPTTQDNQIELPPIPQPDPVTAESFAVKTVTMEDGAMLEIHGDVGRGFEIRRQGRSMPSRFLSLEEAEMAIELFRHRRKKHDTNQDYVDEA